MADVSDEDQVNRMVEEALDRLGRIDVLLDNASFVRVASPITEMTTEEWRRPMAVNLDGPFFCTRAVVPDMIANGWGRIITVSGAWDFDAENVEDIERGAPGTESIPMERRGRPLAGTSWTARRLAGSSPGPRGSAAGRPHPPIRSGLVPKRRSTASSAGSPRTCGVPR